ncbi:hypothetical protein GG344DRAFT_68195 [Lentinula edodes]|nr:hypothetical protein GG344DRAFT_68195 [Lentinula edodes]
MLRRYWNLQGFQRACHLCNRLLLVDPNSLCQELDSNQTLSTADVENGVVDGVARNNPHQWQREEVIIEHRRKQHTIMDSDFLSCMPMNGPTSVKSCGRKRPGEDLNVSLILKFEEHRESNPRRWSQRDEDAGQAWTEVGGRVYPLIKTLQLGVVRPTSQGKPMSNVKEVSIIDAAIRGDLLTAIANMAKLRTLSVEWVLIVNTVKEIVFESNGIQHLRLLDTTWDGPPKVGTMIRACHALRDSSLQTKNVGEQVRTADTVSSFGEVGSHDGVTSGGVTISVHKRQYTDSTFLTIGGEVSPGVTLKKTLEGGTIKEASRVLG